MSSSRCRGAGDQAARGSDSIEIDAGHRAGDCACIFMQSRHDYLATLTVAGDATVASFRASLADKPPPETSTVRLPKWELKACAKRRPVPIGEARQCYQCSPLSLPR